MYTNIFNVILLLQDKIYYKIVVSICFHIIILCSTQNNIDKMYPNFLNYHFQS